MEKEEDLVENLENALKSNINILLNDNSEHSEKSLTDALGSFEESIRKLKSFFIEAQALHKHTRPVNYEQEGIQQMKIELERKDNLIKEQIRKLSRYRAELEVIQEAQVQANSMS